MIELKDKDTGVTIGAITEGQLQFLIDHLEEESPEDRDYYLNPTTLDMMASNGIEPELLTLLRGALGDRDEMEIEWTRS